MESEQVGIPVLILKEGTTRAKGKEAQHANIMAAKVIAEAVKTSLGPKGMDKMLVESFGDITITNDGATILKEMDVQHPAAKMLVEVAKTMDNEVGDGTTSAVVLAGELLRKAEGLIEKDIHPTIVVDGYKGASEKALEFLSEIASKCSPSDRSVLKKIAMTSMGSKAVAEYRDYLAELAVEAVLRVSEKLDGAYRADLDDIKLEKKAGESITDTKLIQGIALDKEVVHASMPKRIEDARIALLNCAIEIEKTEFDAKINIERPDQLKAFMDEESRMIEEMIDRIVKARANFVVTQKGIDDLAQFLLAKKGIMAVRRAREKDLEKLAKATGGRMVTDLKDLSEKDLGYAKLVEERKLGEDKWTFIEGCKDPKAVTILIRGGSEKVVEEAERSLHDALCVVKDVVQDARIVSGGGAVEAEIALRLRRWAESLSGKEQLAALAYAEALETIPTTLAENAGLDPIDMIVELRARHEKGEISAGIDVFRGKVESMDKLDVLEPYAVKDQTINSATEAAMMILRIDDVIAAGKMKEGLPKPPEKPEESSEYE
ncbi:MAG: thermosome subunit beta [Candidatus Bathyarchaeia archaeon]